MKAERAVQPKFRIRDLAACLLMPAAIALFYNCMFWVPNRTELGPRTARIEFRAIAFDPAGFGPLQFVGAWKLTGNDPRFGGVSALALDRGQLLALSDSGVLIRFNPPGAGRRSARWVEPALIGELPSGPGEGRFKRNRDSEALLRDPGGRGWWVVFENRHGLWLYDRDFRRALGSVSLRRYGWRPNKGVEGIAAQPRELLLFPENGDGLIRFDGSHLRLVPIGHARGDISDAAALGPGQVIAIERRQTPLGFRNALVALDQSGSGYRFGRRIALPLGPVDNLEAVAVETLAPGKLRLWLMTDDNLQPPLRTLLIALDWPSSSTVKQAARVSPAPNHTDQLQAER
ncbi:MAG: esterase-like activity of phytase family protein [Sphingomicrobium sp.]